MNFRYKILYAKSFQRMRQYYRDPKLFEQIERLFHIISMVTWLLSCSTRMSLEGRSIGPAKSDNV